jgi:pimeloyl-ACP methyl ester carboxylesterase
MAVLFHDNGSSFVISRRCALLIVWFLISVDANPELPASRRDRHLRRKSEVEQGLKMPERAWHIYRVTFPDYVQRLILSLSSSLTTSNFMKLLLFLISCIWLIRKRGMVKKNKTYPDNAPTDVSDTIGIGEAFALSWRLFVCLQCAYCCSEAITTDPALLKKHSTYATYYVPETGFTYPSIRTFYRPHPQGDKLPSDPTPLPLLVFIHGLGGSIAQFHPLLTSLVNCAPSLAIDLPGCGLSKFQPRSWQAYTTDALVRLLVVIIDKYRDVDSGQGVVLICHSMGCSLAALLASSTSPYAALMSSHVLGLIAICPSAEPPSAQQTATFRKLLLIPEPIFNLWRRWDRRGGTESPSVGRFVGPAAEKQTKILQVRFNDQSRTPVWRRMARGLLPDYSTGEPHGGMPGRKVWSGLKIPLFLIAGEADKVTPVENVQKIASFLDRENEVRCCECHISQPIASPAPYQSHRMETCLSNSTSKSSHTLRDQVTDSSLQTPATSGNTEKPPFKAEILPTPATHSLLYAPRTARPLSAHILSFLATSIDYRLSLGWQLNLLSTEGKWDVKNLEKWQAIEPVSKPIAGVFRAMKTLREVDVLHSPIIFTKEWAPALASHCSAGGALEDPSPTTTSISNGKDGFGAVIAVVDISHESPVYDPRGLEKGGIAYRKFPTNSG